MGTWEEFSAHGVGKFQELKQAALPVGGEFGLFILIFPPIIDKFLGAYPHVKNCLRDTICCWSKALCWELDITYTIICWMLYFHEKEQLGGGTPVAAVSPLTATESKIPAKAHIKRRLSPE